MVVQQETHKILVVDDDELVSEYVAALLEAEGFDVTVMNDPLAARDYFRDNPDEFELVITDQVMPGLTGVEMAQDMMKIRPEVPVLLITGYSERITPDNAASFGLSGFFSKPINEHQFLDKIHTLVLAA